MSDPNPGANERPYDVIPYSQDAIANVVAKRPSSALTASDFKQRSHYYYFLGYFQDLAAETIVVEHDYIDRDYLEDYAGYYARCFPNYRRRCIRLHFFSLEFTDETLEALLSGAKTKLSQDTLQDAYLGFIVIKPLPQTVIGRTCLRTYRDQARRHYPVTRSYDVNLFGLALSVETLAFQEQDEVVSACATSALWSLFQSTGVTFQHAIPTPLQITRSAARKTPMRSRVLPNSGLHKSEIAHAIHKVGLEPEVVGIGDDQIREDLLRANIYAYLKGGIPVLLGAEIYDIIDDPPIKREDHAIAITGFSLGKTDPQSYSLRESELKLTAFRMDKLYVHDDQVGPFARMEFDGEIVELKDEHGKIIARLPSLHSPTITTDGRTGLFRAVPMTLLVPLYHKIRIPFHSIFNVIHSVDAVLRSLANTVAFPNDEAPEWDIYLTSVNDFKKSIISDGTIKGDYAHTVLTDSYPRFLWRCSALAQSRLLFDLIFDATDIEQGNYFHRSVIYDEVTKVYLSEILSIPELESEYREEDARPVFEALKDSI